MTQPNSGPGMGEEVPWSDHVIEYDDRYESIYGDYIRHLTPAPGSGVRWKVGWH